MTETVETNSKTDAMRDLAASPQVRAATVLACAWPALLLATVCLLPFLNKPFVIDDPYFLAMAQQIVKHPTHPMDFTVYWDATGDFRRAYSVTPGNTLMGYVLVPTVLAGAHEWMAHLTQLVLAWIAVVAHGFPSAPIRMGQSTCHELRGLCFWWPSHHFSPWPVPQCPIFSRLPSDSWQWNVSQRGKPNRSGAKARRVPLRWHSQALRGPTLYFFFPSRHSSCWTASIPGRFWHK